MGGCSSKGETVDGVAVTILENEKGALLKAAEAGDMEKLQETWGPEKKDGEAHDINFSFKGSTPCHAAAHNGQIGALEFLLTHGADPNIRDTAARGWTPLISATMAYKPHNDRSHLECIQALLKHGADPNATATGKTATPLLLAVSAKKTKLVELLLVAEGVETFCADKRLPDGSTLLMSAAAKDLPLAILKALLGADQGNTHVNATVPTKTGGIMSALKLAIATGHTEKALVLLQSGARANLAEDDTSSPLTLAAVHGRVGAPRQLSNSLPSPPPPSPARTPSRDDEAHVRRLGGRYRAAAPGRWRRGRRAGRRQVDALDGCGVEWAWRDHRSARRGGCRHQR